MKSSQFFRWPILLILLPVLALPVWMYIGDNGFPLQHTPRETLSSPRVTDAQKAQILAIADANKNGSVSDTEALMVTLDIAEAPDKAFADVKRYDVNGDGIVNDKDVLVTLSALDSLTSK